MSLTPQEEKMQQALREIWLKSRAQLEERLVVLAQAHAALVAGTLDTDMRRRAESAAHRLAGVLGTFGLPRGSALASKLERVYAAVGEPETLRAEIKEWLTMLNAEIAAHDREVEAHPS